MEGTDTLAEQEDQEITELEFIEPQAGIVRDQAGRVLEEFESRIALVERRLPAIWRLLMPSDLVTHDEKTFMICSWGAERIAIPLGISFGGRPNMEKREGKDEKGNYYVWEFDHDFRVNNPKLGINTVVWAMGSCSSRNKLYSRRFDPATKQTILLPMEEVDEQNVKRHAWSSCIRCGVTTAYGIRRLPMEVLPGGWWDKIIHVQYMKGKEGGVDDRDRKKMDEIASMIKDMCGAQPDEMVKMLKEASYHKTKEGKEYKGVSHPRELWGWRLSKTHEKILGLYETWKGQQKNEGE